MDKQYEEEYNRLAERYCVEPFITPKSRLIFILESPHVAEVKNGVPVAGASGATMAKKLFGQEYNKPLGLLLKKHEEDDVDRPSLDTIGLLNVCNIPMQKRPYHQNDIESAADLLERLETIRKYNHKDTFKEEELNIVQSFILHKFRERLAALLDKEVTLVPCGRFAQKFFRLANVSSENWTVIEDVPHPSYNSWSRERYQEPVSQVIEALNRHKV
ncbi:uracil-DNA glycosylase family protein [Alkalihalobacillus sp. CinArs1]|uniref:uracil-DNA glycosylase family protein n=1 Tax=Alkalihalobacillus sp. CinArs1 TaxID=2995314 RepID=UPI0022DD55BE|nr:uracil-DNA glycosylase family protein [Alkalihalobacillus sp. CinArs1]